MTVCAAAICENRMVVGVSDRLVTTGDIQFEPPRSKVFKFTRRVVGFVAGDMSLLDEILMAASYEMAPLIEKSEDDLRVQQIADIYQSCYRDIWAHKAENAVLAPYGLNRETFIARQKEMQPEFLSQLAVDFLKYEPSPEGAEILLAGIDDRGPHLYLVNASGTTCHDTIGFAAIGTGYWHAHSQFMFGQHTTRNSLTRTILQTYWAKKRAEVAPGVGQYTDLFLIYPDIGVRTGAPDFVDRLDGLYQGLIQHEQKARIEAEQSLERFYAEVVAAHRKEREEEKK